MEIPLEQAQHTFKQLLQKVSSQQEAEGFLLSIQHKITTVFSFSDFIQKVALQYPQAFINTVKRIEQASAICEQNNTQLDIDHYKHSMQHIHEQLLTVETTATTSQIFEIQAGAAIREFRHIHMLEIAWFDINHLQSIETSLLAVSNLADTIINEAYECLFKALVKRYGEPENKQALLIMGMGKLGGSELNFSSDIDLIFTYPSQGETLSKKPIEHQVFFTRLAQKLIQMLDQITQHGLAYRVDMRLRPLGESGPIVLPFSALETYYQEQGRQWERFAMQKMRIINNTKFNQSLMDIIKPFVYRKYIDFTTIESIREMKGLIEKEVRRRQISQNIKLGKGGIREVEFFVQSLQLIHAGRYSACQITSILLSMQALEEQKLTGDVNMEQLKKDYLFLRQVEHFLQAFNDQQTQKLPTSISNQTRLAILLGHSSYQQTQENVAQSMQRIHQVFKHIIEDRNELSVATDDEKVPQQSSIQSEIAHALDDIWQLSLDKKEATKALDSHLSISSSELLVDLILKFKKKSERAGVSPRALKSINKLMPLLLCEMVEIETKFDDEVFTDQTQGVFSILQTISGRVTYIDLLLEHPVVRQRLLHLCKKSPWVSSQIAQYPILLDELLHPLYLDKNELSLNDWKSQCADHLRQTLLRVDIKDEEQVMDLLREFKHISQLRIAAGDISGTLAINQVSDKLTILAEVIMQEVINLAWQQISCLFGQPNIAGGTDSVEEVGIRLNTIAVNQLALLAYGKFGGLELSYGSDLDIVFLHNADLSLSTDNTGNRKQVSNQEFYIKLVQRICHICATKTYNGILYDIDLRLRPSGNSGLLISHIDTFLAYQQTNAWTWEHQALVRSRIIVGNAVLTARYGELRRQILTMPRDTVELRQQVFEMREKMRAHLEKKLINQVDIKQTNGGIVDVEFMVQFWVLTHANEYHSITKWSDNLRLLDTLFEIGIIDKHMQTSLREAYLVLRHAVHRIQLANRQFARGGDSKSTKLAKAMQDVEVCYQTVFKEALTKK